MSCFLVVPVKKQQVVSHQPLCEGTGIQATDFFVLFHETALREIVRQVGTRPRGRHPPTPWDGWTGEEACSLSITHTLAP